jgi:methylmalonyl-CoA mutase
VALEKFTSVTPDGVKLGPIHPRAVGPRALRGEPGPWKALSRLDHPSADDFNAQAREDIDNGAEGLTVVFKGSGAAYGFGLARADAAGLDRAFEGVAFDSGLQFSLELAEPAQADAFAALAERLAEPSVANISFGLDPLGAGLKPQVAALSARGFKGPFVAADARIVHDAGGTPAQELAYALSAGVAALRALEDAGAIEFRLAADADQFATIAKFRAMRLLWGRIEEASGLTPGPIRLAATSAWRMMTAVEPYVNVMRAGLAAFAAGLGGADSVTLLPFSQALGLPDAFARRLARNTQLVELREARLGFVADPAAGAGGFEALTTGLCEKAWALFQAQEAAGGLAAALASGLVQKAVAASAVSLQRDVARAKAPLTGLSTHPSLKPDPIAVLPDVAAPKPPLTSGALRPLRLAAPFEQLRERAKAKAPRMFLAAIGPLAAHTRRVGFARDFFEAGGVATLAGPGAEDAGAIAQDFRASGAALACLCGTDEAYAAQAEPFAAALKAAGASGVYLAGRPGEHEAAWRAAGVDGFIFLGADLVASLDEVLRRAGA